MVWRRVCCSRPSRSWGRSPLNIDETTFWLGQLFPTPPVFDEARDIGMVALESDQVLGVTRTFAEVDTGLEAIEEGLPVRSEIVSVARATPEQVAGALEAATNKLRSTGGFVPAQPGTLLPQLLDQEDLSVQHGLFVPPYLWGGETPRVTEPDRLTVLLQLVMLTDAEYAFAVEEGVGSLQQALVEAEIDLLDWQR
ncbi:Suppressor of fused protein (SUFU) [Corynebacterium atrinae]|uniref:suppressor of fused domain protein n=1 Tax=Corynebacterium atrinae TaxID=1336740 RepID=UPI0025B439CE|nr:suppressor of fused domain protein [Corynebacterium atrinae]WJY62317.1 Suppressor of fused protein (SUFU) [Corynebacterium atrinae]